MTFSACYIVKNEEETLQRSIDSLRAVCDEIVVVDTGSEDNTVAIAQAAGARVEHFKWCNDFSKARNYAISQAKGDIIIFLDADEWFEPALTPADKKTIENCLQKGEKALAVRFTNLFDNSAPTTMYLTRIFKNFAGVQYVNPVHEQLNTKGLGHNLPDHIRVYHSGYFTGVQDKAERNFELIAAQIDERTGKTDNPSMYFYAAREANQIGRQEQAIRYLNMLFQTRHTYRYPRHLMIAAHKLRCKLALLDAFRQYDDIGREMAVKEYLQEFPNHPVPWMMQGVWQYEYAGDFVEAELSLRRMDELHAAYRESDYPGDFTNIQPERKMFNVARGVMALKLGRQADSLDFFMNVFEVGTDTISLNYLMHLIEPQPTMDCAAFIDAIVGKDAPPDKLAQLLNILVYYPAKKDLYLYYARKLLLAANEASDLIAVAFLAMGNHAQAAAIARSMSESPRMGAALLCTTLFDGMDRSLLQEEPEGFTGRLIDAFFAERQLGEIAMEEWQMLAHIYRQLLFLGNAEAIARLNGLLEQHPFMRFMLLACYYNVSMHDEEVVDGFDLDFAALTPYQQVFCRQRLGQAYTGLRMPEEALAQFEALLELTGDISAARRDINILTSCCPAHKPQARELIARYETRPKVDLPIEEEERNAGRVVRAAFLAPEQGRLTILF